MATLRPVTTLALSLAMALVPVAASAQETTPVTVDTFVRAETDRYFRDAVDRGCLGTFCHDRQPTQVDGQIVIRMQRDTPYSMAVFDLSSPLTIVKPDIGDRFQSFLVVNQDHYAMRTIYDPGTYTFTEEEMGTRYIQVIVRTFVDPNDPADIAAMHAAQDAIEVIQNDPGSFEAPNWDKAQLDGLRRAILPLGAYVPDSRGMFGRKDQVDPVRHLIGTAGGYAGNPVEDAIYLTTVPERNDGTVPHVLTVGDVPVDGFWSVIVYNKDGFFEAPVETVSVSDVTAERDADGRVTVHFGGDPDAPNYLRIMPGWSYVVRLYRPRAEILDGSWQFPKATAEE